MSRQIGVEFLLAIPLLQEQPEGDEFLRVVLESIIFCICSCLVVFIAKVDIPDVDATLEGLALDDLQAILSERSARGLHVEWLNTYFEIVSVMILCECHGCG